MSKAGKWHTEGALFELSGKTRWYAGTLKRLQRHGQRRRERFWLSKGALLEISRMAAIQKFSDGEPVNI